MPNLALLRVSLAIWHRDGSSWFEKIDQQLTAGRFGKQLLEAKVGVRVEIAGHGLFLETG